MKYTIDATDGKARAGTILTDHGEVQTPVFMPVGTVGSVKTLESREVSDLGASIVLANAYHLYLRPGTELLEKMGGLHRFMAWDKPILVDSGGFQVFSLAKLRKVKEEGVRFQSHIDGSYHLFTPEKVIQIQRSIGPDFVMPLDELVGWPCTVEEANNAAERTWRWLQRAWEEFERTEPLYGHQQILLPIVQGASYPELREREAKRLATLNADAYAIGGLAVGETPEMRNEMMELSCTYLPEDKPRYAMGVGLPRDFLECIARGVDMFDCVVPTRNGRKATVYTFQGKLNLRNAVHKDDKNPLEEGCHCPACRYYSRAYLHHLFKAGEQLAGKLASAHNLAFYFRLLEQARNHILDGDYADWAQKTLRNMGE